MLSCHCVADESSAAGISRSAMPPLRETSAEGKAAGASAGSGGVGPVSVVTAGSRSTLQQQIAASLVQLQHDMNTVLARLHSLETLTRQQARLCDPLTLLLVRAGYYQGWIRCQLGM